MSSPADGQSRLVCEMLDNDSVDPVSAFGISSDLYVRCWTVDARLPESVDPVSAWGILLMLLRSIERSRSRLEHASPKKFTSPVTRGETTCHTRWQVLCNELTTMSYTGKGKYSLQLYIRRCDYGASDMSL